MIHFQDLQEWQDSTVDEGIFNLNVRSLEGQTAYEYLFYSNKLKRTNTGIVSRGIINTYAFLEHGGWWCSGVDPLNNWEPMLWGCFKPRRPRIDFEKRKAIKYEHPPKTETRIFLLLVPDHIWQKVSARYGISITEEDKKRSFWHWAWKHNVPIIITEGAKKAGALLTAGFAAIALPGIYGGYRTLKDEEGNQIGKPYLIPDLQCFATLGREIYFCFDRDQKQKTIRSVNKAIEKTGYLFTQSGCKVRVICLPGPEKGVDDFIMAHGAETFDVLYQAAKLLESWQAQSFTELTYPTAIKVNRRYLGDISIPNDAKLVALKSAKGTGKTQLLEAIVSKALAANKWVLVIGHRVQLVEALCHRFGIPYVTEIRTEPSGAALGYGLCIDSLHPGSQARFNAENWHDGVVILDECEQVIWHALNSSTCQTERVAILKQLKSLLYNVLHSSSGQVYLADADLSDLSIDFVRSLSSTNVEPCIVVNEWQPGLDECWEVYNYQGKDPSGLVEALEKHIAGGGKPFVVCSAQRAKSQWGTRTLERHFNKLFPRKQILRIDSETIADPSHPAYVCVTNLNIILQLYDIVLASPSIETGVSLDLKGHFTSVWGIFQGVQAESSARQALARL
ncbi:plasmid replication protein, CyRepA1 family, partial [Gloeocapsopsis dulcis]